MQDDGSASCACKGIRRCLKCENVKGKEQLETNEPKAVHQFLYDPETRLAVPRDADSSCFSFPGVFLQEDFISEEEEVELIRTIDRDVWNDSQSGRRKQDFGPKVNFKKQKVRLSSFSGLPAVSRSLVLRMQSEASLEDFRPVEQCNLEYLPQRGSSIDPHLDDSWLWVEEVQVSVLLPRRSLLVLFGEARHRWKHSIRREDIQDRRVCSTFRELSEDFLSGGRHEEMGAKLLDISLSFRGTPV
ncbi:alpha-ketoglutarate-dependent dioxygenase alkB homolog 4 isoform X3 [Trematomus bernacchii]|uniref:alpha-ketoglutarate-dependent dioxygenase alkB homolog 4-like isoform X3 n=1 Tax=Trematomus bernacchii TaxID=40690 RepID=UPI00146DD1D0|nr:alpha-ketoglutarate-dependent dioxygenase alkB homolog 4-like isoform X3 [Trematomus bernacchii]XP_033996082.1 alpha-ketoglutarate-dependent dioxygenase alkB homolog 4 isoform X3 [Trematomus bernacchii]